MDIIIDYDNNCVRLNSGSMYDLAKYDFDNRNLKMVQSLLIEVLNASAGREALDVSLCKQDDGTLSTIEDY